MKNYETKQNTTQYGEHTLLDLKASCITALNSIQLNDVQSTALFCFIQTVTDAFRLKEMGEEDYKVCIKELELYYSDILNGIDVSSYSIKNK